MKAKVDVYKRQVLNSVIAPLEDQINGVENMMYMTSNATNSGSADISVDVYKRQAYRHPKQVFDLLHSDRDVADRSV